MNISHALTILLVATPPALAAPHGGQYRGPGGGVPPTAGGFRAPGDVAPPAAAKPPRTTGSTTPPVSGGARRNILGAPKTRASGGGGVMLGEDYSKWQFWWEFNKDSYLMLKTTLQSPDLVAGSDEEFLGARADVTTRLHANPTDQDITERILPALFETLGSTTNRDIVSGCLVALAKIGHQDKDFPILEVFRQNLVSPDQEIRETAALAMGISQLPKAIEDLIALASDSEDGRTLTGRSRVDARTRAFASYGLGLIAHGNPDFAVQLQISTALRSILRDSTPVDRNLPVATLNALGLIRVTPMTELRRVKLRSDLIEFLRAYYGDESVQGLEVVRAHALPALAKLSGNADSLQNQKTKVLLADALDPDSDSSAQIRRSAAIALGRLVLPEEQRSGDRPFLEALRRYYRVGKDDQTRYFSLVTLARAGGKTNREFLLRALAQGNGPLEQPWAALALGCAVFKERTERLDTTDHAAISAAILAAFRRATTPYAKGAIAVSLGLCGYTPAGETLLEQLRTHGHQDELSGYLCVGLALMDYKKARDPIEALIATSIRRPHRLRMAAVALGKLGDRRISHHLLSLLAERTPNVAKMAAVSNALVQIGDRDSINPLREMLLDEGQPEMTRAFAAVALGGIADKEKLPWNAKLAVDMNYRAAVETLIQSGAGVLEIL